MGRGRRSKFIAAFEALEARQLLSASVALRPTFVVADQQTTLNPPFTPSQITTAYGINQITFGSTPGTGQGQTIAIIDAYNDPDIVSDLNTFDTTFGLQQVNVAGGPTFTVENQSGQPINPATTSAPIDSLPGNWDLEESLDVEWARTVAPMANIILIEANTDNNSDLYAAAQVGAATPGVSVVSMSFGGPEDSSDLASDSIFTTPAGHAGVTFVASTGDSGYPGGYPAASPNVVAVGGSSLTINSDGSYGGETGWSGSGGLISQFEPQPTYQNAAAAPFSTTSRTIPDVSWLADPNTGVAVLDSFGASVNNGTAWLQVGGTSLSAQLFGAMISIVDQGRAINGEAPLNGASQTLPALYSLPSSDFNDITSGNNGTAAGVGYDLVTGLGTPVVPALVSGLVSENFIYVDASAPGTLENGSSWTDAYTSIQQVLGVTPSGPEIVLVGQGTYTPTDGTDPTATFQLENGVAMYGGFAGYGAAYPDESGASFVSTLSGVLPNDTASYHIVTASGTDSTAVLDGFTISGGDPAVSNGGGIYNIGGDPIISGCTFTNDGGQDGGGIYNDGASPAIIGCTFTDSGEGIALGGAIYNDVSSAPDISYCTFTANDSILGGAVFNQNASPTFLHCIFSGNVGSFGGGAMQNSDASSPVILDCTFEGNQTEQSIFDGGAIGNDDSAPQIINCIFVGNSASASGGAIYSTNMATASIINCTFTDNSAGNGGAIADADTAQSTIVNSILWNDTGGDISNDVTSSSTVTFSDVGVDPIFVRDPDLADNDYGDLALQETSPFINAGSNAAVPASVTTDIAGNPRIVGGNVDMGAYELFQIYVDAAASGANDGGSWSDAFTSLANALSAATTGETILVSGGTYLPTTGTDRTATFEIDTNLAIYGGYAGLASSSPFTRNVSTYPSILSGAISGGLGSYHVVTINGSLNSTAVFDGFTITDGNADGTGDGTSNYGAGLLDFGGSPTINNCIFSDNVASVPSSESSTNGGAGAAMLLVGASPTISNCTFSDNTATYGAAGAIYDFDGSSPTILDSTFTGNTATNAGGAIYNYLYANPSLSGCTFTDNSAESGGAILSNDYCLMSLANCTFTNNQATDGYGGAVFNELNSDGSISGCTFTTNTADQVGGAMFNYQSSPSVLDCSFNANDAGAGGAIYNFSSSSPSFINCLFVGNSGDFFGGSGGAIYNDTDCSPTLLDCTFADNAAGLFDAPGGAIFDHSDSNPVITNCILWNDYANPTGEIYNDDSTSVPVVTYSDVDGGYTGTGNIDSDPLFVADPNLADDNYGNLQLQPGSPCANSGDTAAIDAAGITTDLAGNPRVVDGIVDMGAYEVQSFGVVWTGGGDGINWGDPANWSDDAVPTQADNVTIPAGVTGLQVANGSYAVATLSSGSNITISDGSLQLLGNSTIGGLLTIQDGGSLDLTDATLIIDFGSNADPIATIASYIGSGYNGGAWNGSGIVSSTVQAANEDGTLIYGIGYADGADGIVSGLSSGQIELKPTLMGDAKLTGTVSFGDFQLLSQYFGSSGVGWDEGNFSYGSTVNFGDFQLLSQNFGSTSALGALAENNTPSSGTFAAAHPVIGGTVISGKINLAVGVFAPVVSVSARRINRDAVSVYHSDSDEQNELEDSDSDWDILQSGAAWSLQAI
jgi:predicted outer membrane repeat protein